MSRYRVTVTYEFENPPEWVEDAIREGDQRAVLDHAVSNWRFEHGFEVAEL